jgi:hypothetical protein
VIANQRDHRVERVEQEVRLDLGAERGQLCLRELRGQALCLSFAGARASPAIALLERLTWRYSAHISRESLGRLMTVATRNGYPHSTVRAPQRRHISGREPARALVSDIFDRQTVWITRTSQWETRL